MISNKVAALRIVAVLAIIAILGLGFAGYIPQLSNLFHGTSYQTTRVMTPSMAPTIKTGAIVLYDASVPFGNLAVGDIILFKVTNGSDVWVSRVIHVFPGAVTTKGDSNPAPEGFDITPSMYVGKVVKIQNP